MKICCIEGCNNKVKAKGYCNKHYIQIRKYGKIKERTIYDPNEIIIHTDYAEIILYDKDCEEIAKAIIDLDDIEKCKKLKWHLGKNNYVLSSEGYLLHRYILNIHEEEYDVNTNSIDHIDTNPLNNRKNNLYICSHKENMSNELTKQNHKESLKGRIVTEETKKKISESNKGKVITEETKKKISETLKGKMTGKNHPNSKPIIAIIEGKPFAIFDCQSDGANFFNITNHISDCCNGNRKSCGKFNDFPIVWKFIYIEEL